MKNTVKAKQKRTVIICIALSVLLLAGSIFVIVDSLIHMNDPYKKFEDENFARAFASALGKESVRDLTDEDILKVESLMYSINVSHDETTGALNVMPVVLMGYKEMTDDIINNVSADSEESAMKDTANFVSFPYMISEADDFAKFENLRVLRVFDFSEVSSMQQGCYYTQLYNCVRSVFGRPYELEFYTQEDMKKNAKKIAKGFKNSSGAKGATDKIIKICNDIKL